MAEKLKIQLNISGKREYVSTATILVIVFSIPYAKVIR